MRDAIPGFGREVAVHERLLAMRLIGVAEILRTDARNLCLETSFDEAWAMAETFDGLAEAVRQPSTHEWVATAERLVRAGIYRHYPEEHPGRLLKSFSRLLLSWVGTGDGFLSGRIWVGGRSGVALNQGRALLVLPESVRLSRLDWSRSADVMRVTDGSGQLIAELDLATGAAEAGPSASILFPPEVGGLRFNPWSEDPVGRYACLSAGKLDRLRRAIERCRLCRAPALEDCVREVVYDNGQPTWVAGRAPVDLGAGVRALARQLVEAVFRDHLERCIENAGCMGKLDLTRYVADERGFRAAIVAVYGRREAASAMGAPLSPVDEHRWEEFSATLRRIPGGPEFEAYLSRASSVFAATAAEQKESTGIWSLAPVLEAGGVDSSCVPAVVRLFRKTTLSARDEVDWSTIDAWCRLSPDVWGGVLRAAEACPGDEAFAWGGAMAAYLLGQFDRCEALLERCIEADPDVEQYQLLIAFTRRHRGDRAGFEEQVFGMPGRIGSR